eukprot:2646017-Rhodomonas_salina.1
MGLTFVPVRTWIASETTTGVIALILGSLEKPARSKACLAALEKTTCQAQKRGREFDVRG